jgi:hypothetical protein
MKSWHDINQKIHEYQSNAHRALDNIRREFLQKLHAHTGRNVIVYYSGFLSKPSALQTEINHEDMNGFMMAIHGMDRKKGLDILLHTPGGGVAPTQSIVQYLHQMFGKDIRAMIPQIAMSAGTMMACSCKEIWMTKSAQLGPTDPHLRGIPAAGVIEEFKRACKEVKADKSKIDVWRAIVSQYRPTFLSQCENAVAWSNGFVRDQLKNVMFDGDPKGGPKANKIVQKLTNYSGNKSHERPIHAEELKSIGLKVNLIEDDQVLQDLVLPIHHCYMHAFMNTPIYKAIENHQGQALFKQQAVSQNA